MANLEWLIRNKLLDYPLWNMTSLFMEIVKNVIFVIKKILSWKYPRSLEFTTRLKRFTFQKQICSKSFCFASFIFIWEISSSFPGNREARISVLKLLCVEQLQIACKFPSEWKWYCWQPIWMHCHGSTKKASFNLHNKLKRKKIKCLWLSSGGEFFKIA